MKPSLSCCIRNISWSRSYGKLSFTGALKPRSSDGSGLAWIPSKVNVCSASVTDSTRPVPTAAASPARRSGRSLPSASSRPSSTGITNGSFSALSGVCGQLWRKVRL
ncbi:hypothetical protein D3C78_1442020 [compost metagenome]